MKGLGIVTHLISITDDDSAVNRPLIPPMELRAEQFRKDVLSKENIFGAADVTVGVENELQAAVLGPKEQVDLALTIEQSNYFRNLVQRAERGDMPLASVADLRQFLDENSEEVWENSWVRFPRHLLSSYADKILRHDLLADKSIIDGPNRSDCKRFLFNQKGEEWLRIPVSYLLKLSLADGISRPGLNFPLFLRTGERLMRHLVSDNISPEITSFSVTGAKDQELPGKNAASETCRRFFFVQLLVCYANRRFKLPGHGQTCNLYFAPNPPLQQKRINDLIYDTFYQDLFLNPCLSGWKRGEDKNRYMALCQRTLSRSQLHTIAKLKEAGIVTNNLVVLPNTSSTSLANNGTHITLGSRALTRQFKNYPAEGGCFYEKYFGDLVIKIVEHFLPLFVSTVSAAPFRLAFSDFHPEKALGFLPHELDYTHLRMIWRRWKKKANLRFCGRSITPLGPEKLDKVISKILRLRGDFVPDIRLVDYLIALQSVEQSPGLNGIPGNQELLKKDLAEMGIFDIRMAMYLPYRLRELHNMGFSGFEGRHYSLFPSISDFMAKAVNLQFFVTALAYRWVATGRIRHHHIPDDPFTESERRQIFFAASIGLPTFFVLADTNNRLLRKILARVKGQRHSRRYKGYIRVKIDAYKKGCMEMLLKESTALFDSPEIREALDDMKAIVAGDRRLASDELTRGIMQNSGAFGNPMNLDAEEFNRRAEQYYRTTLCSKHMQEGLSVLIEDGKRLDRCCDQQLGQIRQELTGNKDAADVIRHLGKKVTGDKADSDEIRRLIMLSMLIIEHENRRSDKQVQDRFLYNLVQGQREKVVL